MEPSNNYDYREPDGNSQGVSILISLAIVAFLLLILIGAVVARAVLVQASVLLFYLALVLLPVIVAVIVGYLLWHKWRMDGIARRQAQLVAQAQADEMRRANERHALEIYLAESRLLADERGNRPFIFDRYNQRVIEVESGNYLQPVPAHLHFEYNYNDESTRAEQAQLATPQNYEQPALASIIEELTPNTLEFVFGLDPNTGQLARTTLAKAVHIQLLGASGQGKSRQATSILTQLCARNDTHHLQLALVDCEGETTAPFQALPHVRYLADEPREAAKVFKGLVNELERRDVSRTLWPVIFIFVEEFLNLRRTMPAEYRDEALENYTTLALRGRKRGMFLFSIGQTAYTERAIRDAQGQFLSSMAFAAKPTMARAAGFTNTELLNKLYQERRPGQFLLERPQGDSILLAPYVDPHVVPGLLAVESQGESQGESQALRQSLASQQRVSSESVESQPDDPLAAKRAQVRQLIASGTVKQQDIILAVWGVRSGSSEKWRQAEQEYKQIMAEIAQGREYLQ